MSRLLDCRSRGLQVSGPVVTLRALRDETKTAASLRWRLECYPRNKFFTNLPSVPSSFSGPFCSLLFVLPRNRTLESLPVVFLRKLSYFAEPWEYEDLPLLELFLSRSAASVDDVIAYSLSSISEKKVPDNRFLNLKAISRAHKINTQHPIPDGLRYSNLSSTFTVTTKKFSYTTDEMSRQSAVV